MSDQAMWKPRLVLMAGLAGAGKTTLALALGRNLQWPVLEKDRIKASLQSSFEERIFLSEDVIGYITYELLFELAHNFLVKQQLSVIIDSPAHLPFILKHASDLIHEADAVLRVILCLADQEVREKRIRNRNTDHIWRQISDPITDEDYLQRFSHLPGERLDLHTEKPVREYIDEAISYLSQ